MAMDEAELNAAHLNIAQEEIKTGEAILMAMNEAELNSARLKQA